MDQAYGRKLCRAVEFLPQFHKVPFHFCLAAGDMYEMNMQIKYKPSAICDTISLEKTAYRRHRPHGIIYNICNSLESL